MSTRYGQVETEEEGGGNYPPATLEYCPMSLQFGLVEAGEAGGGGGGNYYPPTTLQYGPMSLQCGPLSLQEGPLSRMRALAEPESFVPPESGRGLVTTHDERVAILGLSVLDTLHTQHREQDDALRLQQATQREAEDDLRRRDQMQRARDHEEMHANSALASVRGPHWRRKTEGPACGEIEIEGARAAATTGNKYLERDQGSAESDGGAKVAPGTSGSGSECGDGPVGMQGGGTTNDDVLGCMRTQGANVDGEEVTAVGAFSEFSFAETYAWRERAVGCGTGAQGDSCGLVMPLAPADTRAIDR
jgi:hypothetical protein